MLKLVLIPSILLNLQTSLFLRFLQETPEIKNVDALAMLKDFYNQVWKWYVLSFYLFHSRSYWVGISPAISCPTDSTTTLLTCDWLWLERTLSKNWKSKYWLAFLTSPEILDQSRQRLVFILWLQCQRNSLGRTLTNLRYQNGAYPWNQIDFKSSLSLRLSKNGMLSLWHGKYLPFLINGDQNRRISLPIW